MRYFLYEFATEHTPVAACHYAHDAALLAAEGACELIKLGTTEQVAWRSGTDPGQPNAIASHLERKYNAYFRPSIIPTQHDAMEGRR